MIFQLAYKNEYGVFIVKESKVKWKITDDLERYSSYGCYLIFNNSKTTFKERILNN